MRPSDCAPCLRETPASCCPATSTAAPGRWTRWPTWTPARPAGCPPRWSVPARATARTWIFFVGPVPASSARVLGAGLLREAMTARAELDLASYDRFFPAQDFLPRGSLGNLIALPLQGGCRQRGTTVFLGRRPLSHCRTSGRFSAGGYDKEAWYMAWIRVVPPSPGQPLGRREEPEYPS